MLSDGTARRKRLCNPWHCKSINRGIKNGRSNLGTGTIKTAITRDRQGAFDPAWLHIINMLLLSPSVITPAINFLTTLPPILFQPDPASTFSPSLEFPLAGTFKYPN
jgi:hypothetical protein